MWIYENDCVGCPQGCINCGLKKVKHWYCDECHEELNEDNGANINGKDLCVDCIVKLFPIDWASDMYDEDRE